MCDALAKAERPVILTGGGGWNEAGIRSLEGFAERVRIPVVTVFRFHDSYDNTLDTFVGEAGVGILPEIRETIEKSDLILALNIRFGEMTTDNYALFDLPDMRQTLIHVHQSSGELGKIFQPDIAIQSCPNTFAEMLAVHGVANG